MCWEPCPVISEEYFARVEKQVLDVVQLYGRVTREELHNRGVITKDDGDVVKGFITDPITAKRWEYKFGGVFERKINPNLIIEDISIECKEHPNDSATLSMRVAKEECSVWGHFPSDPAWYQMELDKSGKLKYIHFKPADEPPRRIYVVCDKEGRPWGARVQYKAKIQPIYDRWRAALESGPETPCPGCTEKGLELVQRYPYEVLLKCKYCGCRCYLDVDGNITQA